MAVDTFIKLEGINGESKDDIHKNEIDVLSWSWGLSQSGTFHAGGGGGAGKVNVQDLTITKYVDKASPVLMLYCANGDHISRGTMTVRKAGKNPLEYLVIDLSKVMVTSVATGGSDGEERLTEHVTLNFAKVTLHYQEQSESGGAQGGKIDFRWDIPANKS